MTETVRASWRRIGHPKKVLAALSGGADSMALLTLLALLAEQEGFSLCAVHVDHGLRPDSAEDAAFAAAYCQSLGIPCVVKKVRCASASEQDARQARYAAFARVCLEQNADVLALAHHQRDQAETVLMRLFRGSGADGLSGMETLCVYFGPAGETLKLWRPLLAVPPETLRSFLIAEGISWREDATNETDAYSRNYLRRHILPAAEERFPGAEEAVCRAAELLRRDNDCLQEMAERFIRENACLTPPCRYLMRGALARLHPAIQARVLRSALPIALSCEQTNRLLSVKPGDKVNLPGNWHIEATEERLYLLPPKEEPLPPVPLRVTPFTGSPGDGKRAQAMPGDSLPDGLTLRFREAGDRIWPLGAKGAKSLQDYLVDRKVDRPLRDHLPLLCRGREVWWVIGVGPGEQMRVRPGEPAILLRYTGVLPGEMPPKKKDSEEMTDDGK